MTRKNEGRAVSLLARVMLPALALVAGCGREAPLSEVEARERTTRLYTNAMDDYQAGRLDAAIRGFERVVLDEPKSYSAHFQLATLLQDVKQDYIGAIGHYRAYLALRPASDKATVATDRVALCRTLLEAEIVKKISNDPDSAKSRQEHLAAERDALAKKAKDFEAALAKSEARVATLMKENASQHDLLKKLSSEEAGASPATAKEALAQLKEMEAEDARKRLKPSDAELLDDGEDAKPVDDRIRNSADLKKLKRQLAEDERRDAANKFAKSMPGARTNQTDSTFGNIFGGGKKKDAKGPERPSTYTVKEGDTLYALSTRFYGSSRKWREIRDANRAVIAPDGRLRAGQEIKLP